MDPEPPENSHRACSPSYQGIPSTEQDRSRTKGTSPTTPPLVVRTSAPAPTSDPQVGLPLYMPHPTPVRKESASPSPATCVCVCSCECTHSHTLQRACAHSPVLRKSKIAVSLNSFPLAARTAFVLQTKRKRNETEGSEEAGGGREGVRAKEQTEAEGNSKGELEEGKANRALEEGKQRRHRDRLGSQERCLLHPCSLQ